jgi:CAAX protease family protein
MAEETPDPAEPSLSARTAVVLLAVAVEGGLILVAWGVGLLLGYPPLDTLRWDLREAALGLAATLPMLAGFFACLRWPVGPLKTIKDLCDQTLVPLLRSCTTLDLVGIAVLAGLGEEMLFRGVLQPALAGWTGNAVLGLVLTSLLFGLGHAVTPAYTVLATLLGAYLGWLWLWSGNLLLVVIAHAVYDLVALLVLVGGAPPPAPEVSAEQ